MVLVRICTGEQKKGFGLEDRTWIPSFGPHSRIMADPGSVGRRNAYEIYTSGEIVNNLKLNNFILEIKGRFNTKQYVEPGIVLSSSAEKGLIIPKLIHRSDSTTLYELEIPTGARFKYQLKMNSSNSGNGPLISSVALFGKE